MPTISEMSHGYDKSGVEAYLEEIKSIVLQDAAEKVRDVSRIKSVCESEWEGSAREKFVENLQKDANHVALQYLALFSILQNEINSIQLAMSAKDMDLIK